MLTSVVVAFTAQPSGAPAKAGNPLIGVLFIGVVLVAVGVAVLRRRTHGAAKDKTGPTTAARPEPKGAESLVGLIRSRFGRSGDASGPAAPVPPSSAVPYAQPYPQRRQADLGTFTSPVPAVPAEPPRYEKGLEWQENPNKAGEWYSFDGRDWNGPFEGSVGWHQDPSDPAIWYTFDGRCWEGPFRDPRAA